MNILDYLIPGYKKRRLAREQAVIDAVWEARRKREEAKRIYRDQLVLAQKQIQQRQVVTGGGLAIQAGGDIRVAIAKAPAPTNVAPVKSSTLVAEDRRRDDDDGITNMATTMLVVSALSSSDDSYTRSSCPAPAPSYDSPSSYSSHSSSYDSGSSYSSSYDSGSSYSSCDSSSSW